ncbi:acyl-CoA carboxylase subunit beta [Sphaerisporangium rubeum]|uniref:Acetyl-CoA/propionyl-CoA carboxylase carboxyl transferase subunit n=1 Tax=Sphaerisporangium rubeum TaxID=321317 RepID=A0A7X0II70_9ACTN|nr:carboxyl transferase domain-containing protein [Sphaerisporangium rubeum]MBB6475676.1 acetyl-CoA/propionyl-CoA carboxylase carboxyl transferase subunit [Sphaerisporangium rubeum]
MEERDPKARLRALFDHGTLEPLPGDDACGVTGARGRVAGCRAVAFATDPSRMGGALGPEGCARIVETIDLAAAERVPVVGVWHSGGARLGDGVTALHGVGQIFAAMVRASGVVPQISLVLGPAAGGAAYGPALTDIVVMSEGGRIFVTGPDVVREVTGEDVDMEALGGPDTHSRRSGVAHVVTSCDDEAMAETRRVTALLADQGTFRPERVTDTDLGVLLPDRPRRAYDVRPLVDGLVDAPGVELHPRWAPNMVTTLARLATRTVGVLANNPLRKGGCLDAASAEKAARFVRMCDSLGVPLVVVVDVPGYLPGVKQEWDGVVRRGAKLLHAFAEAVVPRVTLVTRKSYGGAYVAMNSRALGASAVFAWPSAEVAVMGASAAVDILHRRKLRSAPADRREELRRTLITQQEREAGGVAKAVEIGVVDEVIDPKETRRRIADALLEALPSRGHHTNIPL